MAIETTAPGTPAQWRLQTSARDGTRRPGHRHLSQVFETAPEIPFDDTSRIVFFSDCHRGDSSPADEFARNETLFLHALGDYYRRGFTYVEVGDGDEMWLNNRFSDVRRAHVRTFDRLHDFDREGRLHLLLGNHDSVGVPDAGQALEKDGIPVHEGLILRHTGSGQAIFAVHGHQSDFWNCRLPGLSYLATQLVWRRLQPRVAPRGQGYLGAARSQLQTGERVMAWCTMRRVLAIEQRTLAWAQASEVAVICGHTHLPRHSAYGLPYFNAGSCIAPGAITGLEIEQGQIALVRWSAGPVRSGMRRELLAAPRGLHQLSWRVSSPMPALTGC